jgi:hypothetical protein
MQIKESLKKYREACDKLKKWDELYSNDDFEISSDAKMELEELQKECDGTPESIVRYNKECGENAYQQDLEELNNQILYNEVTDIADAIYSELLESAKIIASDLEACGIGREEFLIEVYNMGIIKSDIDYDKEFNEELNEDKEPIYPITKKVEPIIDEDELKKILFG